MVALGLPVLFWSKYLWLPIVARKNHLEASLGNLLKGLFSVVVWVPFYGLFVTITLGGLAMFVPAIGSAVRACPPLKAVLMSSAAVFGLMGAKFQAMNGDATQTPAALSARVAYLPAIHRPMALPGSGSGRPDGFGGLDDYLPVSYSETAGGKSSCASGPEPFVRRQLEFYFAWSAGISWGCIW